MQTHFVVSVRRKKEDLTTYESSEVFRNWLMQKKIIAWQTARLGAEDKVVLWIYHVKSTCAIMRMSVVNGCDNGRCKFMFPYMPESMLRVFQTPSYIIL